MASNNRALELGTNTEDSVTDRKTVYEYGTIMSATELTMTATMFTNVQYINIVFSVIRGDECATRFANMASMHNSVLR
jgi:hypothetical protein